MKNNSFSIFHKYYSDIPFIDRYLTDMKNSVDVIIPLMHTNELWEKNLLSIYREIPVKNLLIGDGGCIDNSVEIVKKFPRVKVFNHRSMKSLGYSIRKLIEKVDTEWFVYLHSDVYLPKGWFDVMKKNQENYDWFESNQKLTVLVEYPLDYSGYKRPLSGSQMGRTKAFKPILSGIDDDYLYRNEDIIFAELLKRRGYRYGRVDDTYHYHQMMDKKSKWSRRIKSVTVEVTKSNKEEYREVDMQVKGIIKYINPTDDYLILSVTSSLEQLYELKDFNFKEFEQWVRKTNSQWLPYIKINSLNRPYVKRFIYHFYLSIRKTISKILNV